MVGTVVTYFQNVQCRVACIARTINLEGRRYAISIIQIQKASLRGAAQIPPDVSFAPFLNLLLANPNKFYAKAPIARGNHDNQES